MASNSAIYCAFSDDNCDLSCVFDADFRSCFLNGILTRSWALWKTEKWVLDAEINFWYTHATLKWIFFLHTAVLSHRAPATGQGRPYRTDRSDFTDHILERLRKYNSINYSLFFWYKFGLQSPRVRNNNAHSRFLLAPISSMRIRVLSRAIAFPAGFTLRRLLWKRTLNGPK